MDKNIRILQEQCETIIADTLKADGESQAVEDQIRASMASVAQTLLPAFSFDTSEEKSTREDLVRDCGALLPKLVSSLWRRCVDDHLKAQEKPAFPWTR